MRLVHKIIQPLRRQPKVFHLIRACVRPGRAAYQHLYFKGPFTVHISEHLRFNIHHFGYQVENELFWAGFGRGYEGMSLRVWRAFVETAEFIADVGANTGVYALTAAAVNPKAHIIALEPVPRIFRKLSDNLALNPFNVKALQIAASDADGEAILFDVDAEHNYSASLDATMLAEIDTLRVPVRAAKLDTLLDEMNWARIDLLKIDVEKHEPAVLAGMKQRMAQDKPTMLVEILNGEIGAAITLLIEGLGYKTLAIDEDKGLIETTNLVQASGRNFLFCNAALWERLGAQIKQSLL